MRRTLFARFGEFTLDHENRVLARAGSPVEVQPKVFDCIELLSSRAGKLTTTAQLRQALWPGLTVGDAALRKVVSKARAALRPASPIHARKGLGYGFMAEVVVEHDAATPTASEADRWPFVGRERELLVVQRAREDASAGHGRLVLIGGEAGSGKTALLDESRRSASTLLWLVGSSAAGLALPSYWAWRQIARQLCESTDAQLDAGARRFWQHLAEGRLPHVGSTNASGERRLLVGEAIATRVLALARVQPLCLEFDDLHWADAGSLIVFEMLARAVADSSILLLATYRTEALATRDATRALLGRVSGRKGVSELAVGALTTSDVHTLLAALRHPHASEAGAALLQRQTGGLALFVQQLARHTLQARVDDALALPPSSRLVFDERLTRVRTETRNMLSHACIFGSEFELASLIRLMGDAESVREQVDEARAHGLLRDSRTRAHELAFTHALLVDCLYDALTDSARARLHARVFDVLDERAHEQRADHAYRAGGRVDLEQTRALCAQAGSAAYAQLAFDRAFEHLTRALSLRPETIEIEHRAELSLLRARAAWEADRSLEEIEGAFRDALRDAQQASRSDLLAEAAIGLAVGEDSPLELHAARLRQGALEHLMNAYEVLGEHGGPRKHRVARTLCWMFGALGDRIEGLRWAHEALRSSDAADGAWSRLLAQGIACVERVWAGQRVEAVEQFERMRPMLHHPDLTARERVDAQLQWMTLCHLLGETAEFEVAIDDVEAAIRELPESPCFGRVGARFASYRLVPGLARMTLEVVRGRFEAAQTKLAELVAEASRIGLSALDDTGASLRLFFPMLHYQGRSQILQAMIDGARAALGELDHRLMSAHIALECGALPRANEHYDALRRIEFSTRVQGRVMPPRASQWVSLADLCVGLGRVEDAARIADELSTFSEFCAAEGIPLQLGSCARALGELSWLQGDAARAETLLHTALRMNQRADHQPEVTRTKLALARLAWLHDAHAEAKLLVDEVVERAGMMSMQPTLLAAQVLALSFVTAS